MRSTLIKTRNYLVPVVFGLSPAVGLVMVGLLNLKRRSFVYSWLKLWPIFFLLLALSTRGVVSFTSLLAQFALYTVASALLALPHRKILDGFLVALGLFLCAALYEHHLSAHSWYVPSQGSIFDQVDAFTPFRNGRKQESSSGSYRSWKVADGTDTVRLQLEARLVSGHPEWDWYRSKNNFKVERLTEGGQALTRITFPPDGDPFVFRGIDTGSPIAQRRFRMNLELRSPNETRPCGRVYLAERGAEHASFQEVCPTGAWQNVTIDWLAPSAATSPILDVIVNDFDAHTVDTAHVGLEEWIDGRWRALGPLGPSGASVHLSWEGQDVNDTSDTSVRFLPTEEWGLYTAEVHSESLAKANTVRAALQIEQGVTIETRNVHLTSPAHSDSPRPLPSNARLSLWFGDPNLAGHTIVTIGLVAVTVATSGARGGLAAVATLVLIWFTGSRAAWLAALLGFPWLFWLFWRSHHLKGRSWLLIGFALGSAGLVALLTKRVGGLQPLGDELANRLQIWQVAQQALLEHPWTGIGTDFATYWQQTYSGENPEIITHAHSLWLQSAAAYGVPGLLAVLWLTGGFLYLAWRWGRGRGLALVVPIFVMNLFDYTFFYSGVLFPLILGMNALRSSKQRGEHETNVSADDTGNA